MIKYAILFPGQGAQFFGMGKSFYEQNRESKAIYDLASQILGVDLKSLCFEENDMLNQTINTQKSIVVTSIAIYKAIEMLIPEKPYAFVGFSLGEYSALYASKVFSLELILDLINKRSIWMQEASILNPGSMVALQGGDIVLIQDFCDKVTKEIGNLQISNFNSPQQKVLSGTNLAIEYLLENFQETKAKRAVKLNVSGAFHSPLMSEAASKMEKLVSILKYYSPQIPIIMNTNASYLDIKRLPELMKKQIETPVLFEDSIRLLIQEGVSLFIEVGPGQILSSLVKKIDSDVKTISISEISDLSKLEDIL
ncbi:MAG: ACP S-malonyltransferase [Candidatus Izemoplasmatales bacterium]|jgi:[acyl-carrier-protein] S-malonyltransferase|nr:ACP S-malonyltransferase [Candidatus Izemoplasmatales bacterium]